MCTPRTDLQSTVQWCMMTQDGLCCRALAKEMDAQLMVVDLEHLLAVAADAIPPAPASDAEPAGSGCGDGA